MAAGGEAAAPGERESIPSSAPQGPSCFSGPSAAPPPKGNGKPAWVLWGWEEESGKGLQQHTGESVPAQSIGLKAELLEEDEWDGVDVLELLEEGSTQHTLGGWAGERLPPPIPREAWVEQQAFEPCRQGPLWARLRQVQGQALSQQLGPRKQRPSRFRRALRALRSLFRCPCLAPRPQD